MVHSRRAATSRGLLGSALLAACGLAFVGCGDNSTGAAPELSPADIEKHQADEAAARVKAYGKTGATPTSRNAAKAAVKAAAKAAKVEEAPEAEEKPAP